MDLRNLIGTLRHQIIVIVSAAVIGLSVGAVTALLTPQQYRASVQQMVTVDVSGTATPAERALANSYAVQAAESYRTILASSLVLQPVIDDLGLEESSDSLDDRISSTLAPRGVIITTTVTDRNPGQAARIANAIAESFSAVITDKLERRDQRAAYRVRIVTVQPATVPTTAAAPNLPFATAAGGVLGLAAGLTFAVLRAMLDRRIRTIADVDDAVEAPVIGTIPYDAAASQAPLVIATDPRSPRAEAYRGLRTNLRFLFPRGRTGVFVVTSAGASEGKSTTGSNLALALSESGYRVALIDADLRKPRVAGLFGIEGAIGLSDVLIGRVGVHEVIQRWGRSTLFVLPAGSTPPNPAEMLGSKAMGSLIGDLQAAFDVVIIDAPPVLPVTDAAVISRFATGVLLVTAAEATTRDNLSLAAERIHAVGSTVLGTIITMLPARSADAISDDAYGHVGAA